MSMAMIVLCERQLHCGSECGGCKSLGSPFSMVMSKCVRDVEQKERLDTAILEFVILRGSLLSRCKTLVRALSCHDPVKLYITVKVKRLCVS